MEKANLDDAEAQPDTDQTPPTIEEHADDIARWEDEGGPASD